MKPLGVLSIMSQETTASVAKPAMVIHLRRKRKPRLPIYLSVIALKPALKAAKKREPNRLLRPSAWWFRRNKADNAGLNVNALTAEIRIAIASVNANCL